MPFAPTRPSAASPITSATSMSEDVASDAGDGVRKPRTLILCFDGTSNQYDGDNTNVVKFYSLLQKDDDNTQQLCYYQPGVGTYFNPGVVSPLFQWGAKIMDEAFAWYLDAHVRGGYQFLMQNYNAGDKICLFGFSRGAYTARAVAGMLHKIGLLPRDNPEQIPFAYKLYKKTDKDSLALAAGFKQTFCRTVQIEFVGVWETVSSVGVLMSRTLPFTAANMTIKKFRHALALDEHRVKFLPNLYHWDTEEQTPSSHAFNSRVFNSRGNGETHSGDAWTPSHANGKQPSTSKRLSHGLFGKSSKSAVAVEKSKLQQNHAEEQIREGRPPTHADTTSLVTNALGDRVDGGTDVLEVWFAGCHADIGGGSVPDDVKISLSDITLRWMVREMVLAQCGITFDQAALVRANIPESIFRGLGFPLPEQTTFTATPQHIGLALPVDTKENADGSDPSPKTQPIPSGSDSGSGGDTLDCAADALAPINDQMKRLPVWWLLEIVPTWWPWQNNTGKWTSTFWPHLGRGRQIPDGAPPKFHVTVQERMQDPTLKYTPRAKWTSGVQVYVN
ncbi:hypothetical protein C8Q79DRAFT_999579 [Trametes meyenii]|nr:hypothetical protein C8Q79DRAFT_999579 [Trametes meyenii]